jgi:ubiquinol-cytochrome c reductase cytochrome c subunit
MIDWIVLAAATAASTPAPAAGRAQPGGTASVEDGKRLYTAYYCYACHGTVGQGGAAPRLVIAERPDPMIRFVRKPTGAMPPYTSRVISDRELALIHAYLRSIPPSPPARSLALLNR